MTRELQSTLQASGTWSPAMRTHIPCMALLIQLALGAFISNLGVKGCAKSWEAHERNQQLGENESTNIGKIQRLRKEGNVRIRKVLAMWPSLAKIIDKVHISRHFERSETDLHIAENACCIDYADTWSSKRVHWHPNGQGTNRSTTYYGCENTVEFNTGVAWASLPITRIHLWVAEESQIQWSPATLHNTGRMDHRQVHQGSFKEIASLDPVDVEKAFSNSASCHHCLQWHVGSYGCHYASFGYKEDTMEGRLILCCEGCMTKAVQIVCWNHSNDRSASLVGTYPWSFPEVAII